MAALAADPNVNEKAGRVWTSWTLAEEYGFRDADGRRPDWGDYFDAWAAETLDRRGPLQTEDHEILKLRRFHIDRDPTRVDEARRIEELLEG